MPTPVVSQYLPVSFKLDRATGREFLEYQRYFQGVLRFPKKVYIDKEMLQGLVKGVRSEVKKLIGLALNGHSRGGEGVEDAAALLAKHVLPKAGFAEVVELDVHPQFYMIEDAAAEIPWEALEENYDCCPKGHKAPAAPAGGSTVPHCPHDGLKLSPACNKLVLARHVTHLIPREARPLAERRAVSHHCGSHGRIVRSAERFARLLRRTPGNVAYPLGRPRLRGLVPARRKCHPQRRPGLAPQARGRGRLLFRARAGAAGQEETGAAHPSRRPFVCRRNRARGFRREPRVPQCVRGGDDRRGLGVGRRAAGQERGRRVRPRRRPRGHRHPVAGHQRESRGAPPSNSSSTSSPGTVRSAKP